MKGQKEKELGVIQIDRICKRCGCRTDEGKEYCTNCYMKIAKENVQRMKMKGQKEKDLDKKTPARQIKELMDKYKMTVNKEKEKELDYDWRMNGKNFRLFKPEEDIRCPMCNIGKLNKQNKIDWKCSVCGRWFEEIA